jgi:hypothetical protein
MPKIRDDSKSTKFEMRSEMTPEERRVVKCDREKNKKEQDKKRAQERNQRDKMRG